VMNSKIKDWPRVSKEFASGYDVWLDDMKKNHPVKMALIDIMDVLGLMIIGIVLLWQMSPFYLMIWERKPIFKEVKHERKNTR